MKNDEKMARIMNDQDYLYTCVTKGSDDLISTRVSGSMVDYIWAGQGAKKRVELIKAMTDPQIKLVSMTITEKGY